MPAAFFRRGFWEAAIGGSEGVVRMQGFSVSRWRPGLFPKQAPNQGGGGRRKHLLFNSTETATQRLRAA
jgi:hypothetical protein